MRVLPLIAAGAALITSTLAIAQPQRLRGEERLAQKLEGRVAGEPVNCINLRDIQSSEIIDRTAIVYKVGRKLFVNRPRGGEQSLHRDDILLTKTIGSRLCSIDTVQLLDPTSRSQHGFVALGEFVPYTKVQAN